MSKEFLTYKGLKPWLIKVSLTLNVAFVALMIFLYVYLDNNPDTVDASAKSHQSAEVLENTHTDTEIDYENLLALLSLFPKDERSKHCAALIEYGVICVFDEQNVTGITSQDIDAPNVRDANNDEDVLEKKSKDIETIKANKPFYVISDEPTVAISTPRHVKQGPRKAPFFAQKDFDAYDPTLDENTLVAQAADAAMDMVKNRYTQALEDAKSGGGNISINEQHALNIGSDALNSAAIKAFEAFMKDASGAIDFGDKKYDDIRGDFISAFEKSARASLKSVAKNAMHDLARGQRFKDLSITSQLLKDIDDNVAKALIDTGVAAAHNSKYAFLHNLEVSYSIRENAKPEYSLLTVQPIVSSKDKKHNVLAQAAFSYEEGRQDYTAGLGYRYMPDSHKYVVGANTFFDFQRPYNHIRGSVGLDFQTNLIEASTNFYKAFSDWKSTRPGYEERALDGYDVEVSGRMPFLPALEVFGKGYRWQSFDSEEDVEGTELRVEYTPVPAVTLEALFNDENKAETSYGFGVRYNHIFGAPPSYMYDWQEQFRQKDVSEYVFRKVRRENQIRVQERSTTPQTPLGPALVNASPLAGSSGVSIGTDVTFTFASNVQAGSGNIEFTDTTDGSNNFFIPVSDPRVMIAGSVVSIDLSAQLLEFSSNYEVSFAAGVFADVDGNATQALTAGTYDFTTVVNPIAGFPAPDALLLANTTGTAFTPRSTTATWQTTIDVGNVPNGVIFETGATGRGTAAWFDAGVLRFAGGEGSVTSTGAGAIFGTYPISSIPQGRHHFVFVAKPTAPAEIGVYMDGIRIITQSTVAAMSLNEWAGTDSSGYGLFGGSIRAGGNGAPLTGATLTNNLRFFSAQQPADF